MIHDDQEVARVFSATSLKGGLNLTDGCQRDDQMKNGSLYVSI